MELKIQAIVDGRRIELLPHSGWQAFLMEEDWETPVILHDGGYARPTQAEHDAVLKDLWGVISPLAGHLSSLS